MPKTWKSATVALGLMLGGAALAAPPVNTLEPGFLGSRVTDVAIRGYDPVAYFTQSEAVPGDDRFVHEWRGAQWKFASREHLEMFAADPERYAPQYGGYCAYGVAVDNLVKIDPEAWDIVEGKLYLNYDTDIQRRWQADRARYIREASRKFERLLAE